MIATLTRWWTRLTTPRRPLSVALFPHLPPHQRECPKCHQTVTHWMTFADGRILCAACDQLPIVPSVRALRKAGRA